MAQGSYDHPAYLARFPVVFGDTTAGASGTGLITNFPVATKLRNVTATVKVAGTSATTGNKVDIFVGTTSVGSITLGTSAAQVVGTSGDLNQTIGAGTAVYFKNGTDATGTARLTGEMSLAPDATWS